MGASVIVPGVLGALGLMQGNQQANAQRRTQEKGLASAEKNDAAAQEIRDILKGIADKYNPREVTDQSIGHASDVAGATLDKSLRGLTSRYGGDNPGGDTGFSLSAQRATNDVLDPLKLFAAQERSMEASRKADMYQRVLGVPPSQMSDAYFKSASMMPRTDPTGSLAMLSQSIQRMLNPTGGAGGRGDYSSPINDYGGKNEEEIYDFGGIPTPGAG